jgi:hypothetical protein
MNNATEAFDKGDPLKAFDLLRNTANLDKNDPRIQHNAAVAKYYLFAQGTSKLDRAGAAAQLTSSLESVITAYQQLSEAFHQATPTKRDKSRSSASQSPSNTSAPIISPSRPSQNSTPSRPPSRNTYSTVSDHSGQQSAQSRINEDVIGLSMGDMGDMGDTEEREYDSVQFPIVPPTPADTAYAKYNLAVVSYQTGKYAEAASHLESIVDNSVLDAVDDSLGRNACFLLADVRLAMNDPKGVFRILEALETVLLHRQTTQQDLKKYVGGPSNEKDTDETPVALDELVNLSGARSSTPKPESPGRSLSTFKPDTTITSPPRRRYTPSPSRSTPTPDDDYEMNGPGSFNPWCDIQQSTSIRENPLTQFENVYMHYLKARAHLCMLNMKISQYEIDEASARYLDLTSAQLHGESTSYQSAIDNSINIKLLGHSIGFVKSQIQFLSDSTDKCISDVNQTTPILPFPSDIVSLEISKCKDATLGILSNQMRLYGVADGFFRKALQSNNQLRRIIEQQSSLIVSSFDPTERTISIPILHETFDSSKFIKYNHGLQRLHMLQQTPPVEIFVDPLAESSSLSDGMQSITAGLQWLRAGEAALRSLAQSQNSGTSLKAGLRTVRCGKYRLAVYSSTKTHPSFR